MTNTLQLNPQSRVLILAPHPDDESLATGGLLCQAVAVRAAVKVVFITGGENNPWPQRVIECHWRIGPADQVRWKERRQREALAALKIVGVPAVDTTFLDFPDQGLTEALMKADDTLADQLATLIDAWQPTLLVSPSLADIHPDHSAAAMFVHQAMARLTPAHNVSWFEYIVHTRAEPAPDHTFLLLRLSREHQEIKRSAIACHQSQTLLRPRSLYAFADRAERFYAILPNSYSSRHCHPVQQTSFLENCMHLELLMSACLGAFGRVTLYLVSECQGHATACLSVALPHFSRGTMINVRDTLTGRIIGHAWFKGGPRRATIQIDPFIWRDADQLFVKLERGFGFFDEAGWREVPVFVTKTVAMKPLVSDLSGLVVP